jgi:hypothetical protein
MSDQPGIELRTDGDYDVSRLRNLPIGCLLWMLALLLLFGIVVFIVYVYRSSGPPAIPSNAGAATSQPSSATPAGCEDATAAFRAAGGSQLVQRVCWEASGHLRAEAGFSVDAEPASPPMRTICTALSDFAAGSGKAWQGFTVYSTHQLSPGRAILTSSQPGQCARP